ncbi:MAG: hypothetical protein GY769_08080 [bacterium]|nr:hypothetical protein [bacterium]
MIPCQHLDFHTKQTGCRIARMRTDPTIRFWKRSLSYWDTCSSSEHSDRKRSDYFQRCKLHGTIEGVICCFQKPGPKDCYEPEDGREKDR